MRSSGYLADYKVFFARYWFKLSAATFHPYIGGPHFETMATLELADIANGDKWIANLADCEHNYRLCPLEVLREQRNLYFKLTVIAIRRLQVLKDLCLKEGFSPSSPLAIGIAGLLTPTLALARSTTATLSVFTARELHRLHLLGKIMV